MLFQIWKKDIMKLLNMPTVSEDLLRIVWKCMKIALIIHLYTYLFQILLQNKQKSIRNSCNSNLSLTP